MHNSRIDLQFLPGLPAPSDIKQRDLGIIFNKKKGTLRDQFSIKIETNFQKKGPLL